MKKYVIIYRDEFITEVMANSKDEAIEKCKNAKWEVLNDLFFEFMDFKTENS